MADYASSIRRIEHTSDYTPIRSLNRYAIPPQRYTEGIAGECRSEWSKQYFQAADSAAEWLKQARAAQTELDNLHRQLGSSGWEERSMDIRNSLSRLIASLQDSYRQHAGYLHEEVWSVIALALRHPAIEALAIEADGSEEAHMEEPLDASHVKRLLGGTDGLLTELNRALSYAEQRRGIDLLKLPFPSAYPYAMYYGAMYTYWPLPARGLLVNKYY
ncbi:hypothetical protein M6D81_25165 [Paenibacillus sp. J5C_2022]|uniref:hypothetical protein n=1 Tax=Paenibacillus sp. J5C2022 TaxID=2977129 RepID=UPI0021D0F491|nr:hypothetical protein [Paenibacillus sp. J5C2022]MCU6711998.1 hypothetical protein [Paenibacillus sp. J5C2022]